MKNTSNAVFGRTFVLLHARSSPGGGATSVFIQSLLADVHRTGKPVVLQVLKANRARRLYERLGFVMTGESETHYVMRALPPHRA
jgi:hypothetical protein